MSQTKRELEKHWDLQAAAQTVLVKARAADRCEIHEEILIDRGDGDGEKMAYAIATNMVKAREVDGTREEFLEAVKEALGEADYQCNICANQLSRD